MRSVYAGFMIVLTAGCSHPLAIQGRGDIVELNEQVRGCTYEEFQAGAERCENWVSGSGYDVRFMPVPHDGWQFTGWGGLGCNGLDGDLCTFSLTEAQVAAWVDAAPYTVFPATLAIFEPATGVAVSTSGVPLQDNKRYQAIYQVTNTADVVQNDVVLYATIPAFSGPVTPASETVPPADCDNGAQVCLAGEQLRWDVGQLQPGDVALFSLSEFISSLALEGDVAAFDAQLRVNGTDSATTAAQLVLSEDKPEFQVDLLPPGGSANPGDTLTQRVTFSNLSVSLVADELQVTLDPRTTFVSATGGGSHADGIVTWPISLGAGGSDSRELTVGVEAAAGTGALLESTAVVRDTTSGISASDTEQVAVSDLDALRLTIISDLATAPAGGQIRLRYLVENTGALPLSGVILRAVIPAQLGQVTPAVEATPAGFCVSGSTSCSAGQGIQWNIGPLPAGETRAYTVTENIVASVDEAELMSVIAMVSANGQPEVLGGHTVVLTSN
jgi:hypothetical protein